MIRCAKHSSTVVVANQATWRQFISLRFHSVGGLFLHTITFYVLKCLWDKYRQLCPPHQNCQNKLPQKENNACYCFVPLVGIFECFYANEEQSRFEVWCNSECPAWFSCCQNLVTRSTLMSHPPRTKTLSKIIKICER